MSEFTPGPWRWVKVVYGLPYASGYYEIDEDGPFDALWSDTEGKIVFVSQDASSYRAYCDFRNDNDARLIAAAPELLRACELALEYSNRDMPWVREAIAKATS